VEVQRDIEAGAVQVQGDGTPDAPGAAGDNRNFVIHHIHPYRSVQLNGKWGRR
jgi:hypothetical protein